MSELVERLLTRRDEIAAEIARVAAQKVASDDELNARALSLAIRQPVIRDRIQALESLLRDESSGKMSSIVLGADNRDGARIEAVPKVNGDKLSGFTFKAISVDDEVSNLDSEDFALGGGISQDSGKGLRIKDGSFHWHWVSHIHTEVPDLTALEIAEHDYQGAETLLDALDEKMRDEILNPELATRIALAEHS